MATSWPTTLHTGFGAVVCDIYRDDGSTLMPEWTTSRRLVTRQIANGGTSRQTLGFNPDSITVILEVLNASAARALRAMAGETDTLTLRDDTGSKQGTHEIIHERGFFHHTECTLVSLESLGMRRNGRFRFRATFERDRT